MKLSLIVALWLCFSLSPLVLHSQEDSLAVQAETLRKKGSFNKALDLFYQYLNESQETLPIKDEASILYKMAACYFNLSEYDSTIKYMKRALVQKEKILAPTDTFLISSHAVLGYIYRYERPDIRKAVSHFDSERGIMDTYPRSFSTKQLFQNYYNLASTNRILEDYDRSLNYAYQALEVAQSITSEPQLAENCYLVIANSLSGKKEYEQADEFYRKKISISIEQRGANHASLALDYYNLALNHSDLSLQAEAIVNFRKAERIAVKHNTSLLSNIYRGLGVAHRLSGNTSLSIEYLYKAASLANSQPLHSAWAYRQIASHYEIVGLYDSARHNFQKAFKALIPDFEWTSLNDNPPLNSLVTNNPYVYTILELKANCSLREYRTTQQLTSLQVAKNAYNLLDDLTDRYRDNLVLESSRLFFQQKNYEVYEKAIEVNYELYLQDPKPIYIENCWKLIEKNKSILLLENLLKAEKEVGLKLPDSVRDLSRAFSQRILKAQKDIRICESSGDCDENRLIALRNTISTNEDFLRKHQLTIKEGFTDYYNFAENQEVISLSKVQQSVEKDVIMLNYFATNKNYYLISASKNGTSFHSIKRDSILDQSLTAFLAELSGETLQHQDLKTGFDKFTKNGNLLSTQLIPSALSKDRYKKIIIIPDGLLSLIPFEVLPTSSFPSSEVNFASLPYLIKSHQINYGYSATLWFRNSSSQKPISNTQVVAFGATELPGRPELARLNAVSQEMQSISRIDNARIFSDTAATEENFKTQIKEAEVIHLALHNVNDYTNPLNSQLVFYTTEESKDSGLYLYEIFNIQMNPSLVVLSGCETGIGKWQKGEGAYHMGRGFLYHGNPALVLSLWKVKDYPTSMLMSQFYTHFKTQKSSSEALRLAKLHFLTNEDEAMSHPSNWAAFVSLGDAQMTTSTNYLFYILCFAIGSFLLIVGLYFYKMTPHSGK